MLYLRFVKLRRPKSTYSVFKLSTKIAELSITDDGTRTVTPRPGRELQTSERRGIEAYQPRKPKEILC